MPRSGVFGGTNSKPTLEIVPDSSFIVFYGEPSESQVAELTGKVVLTLPESLSSKCIKVTLLGTRRVSWHTQGTVTPQPILHKRQFLREELHLLEGQKNKPHKLNPGVHEFSFKFSMPSHLEESVEGIGTNWIVYQLSAEVERGYLSKHLTATKPIRVIRTLGRDLMDTVPMEQINEDIWASKIAYKITVPQKNYIVGTPITADFVLIPLRKGVQISTIKMDVVETRMMYSEYAGRRISQSVDNVVVTKEGEMPENSARLVPGHLADAEEADHLFDESHRFKMTVDLPKSLKQCRQSVDTEYLRIMHKLRLYVNLKNSEGHTSQLLVKNHLHLFISPNLPPNEDQSVVVDQNVLSSAALRDDALQNAPPTYDLHQLDQLYSDIDPSGFMTPSGHHSSVNSGSNTPFYGHSRAGSAENLPSLDTVAEQNGGGASASALHSRLQNLDMNDSNNRARFATTRHHSSGGSTPADSRNSGYFPSADVGQANYDMEALARTPSYNTAVRTPAARTPIHEGLPSYEVATSRPASPVHTPRSGQSTPSPARSGSLDTLSEETMHNTQFNSRRASPRHSPRTSNEGSPRTGSTSSLPSLPSGPSTRPTTAPSSSTHLPIPKPLPYFLTLLTTESRPYSKHTQKRAHGRGIEYRFTPTPPPPPPISYLNMHRRTASSTSLVGSMRQVLHNRSNSGSQSSSRNPSPEPSRERDGSDPEVPTGGE